MREPLSIAEHGSLPIGDGTSGSLTLDEVERLERITERRRGFCVRRHDSVRFAHYAGLVSLGNRMLEIVPKIDSQDGSIEECRGLFLRLLRLAPSLKIHLSGAVSHNLRHGTLLEIFLHAFFDEVMQLAKGGLLRRYERHEADLSVVRGRLAMGRQITTHAMRPDVLACRYQTLSIDNDWNRVLKAALSACRSWLGSLALRRRWAALWAAFDQVALPARTDEIFAALSPDRRSTRYEDAVRWARWIVASTTPDLHAGSAAAPAMLFDTNALFEEAVSTTLRSRLAANVDGLVLRTQVADRSLAVIAGTGREAVGLRPDMVCEQERSVAAVLDVKWKRLDRSGQDLRPAVPDVQQMFAYAAAFGCERLALIYPWHSGLEGAKPTVLELPAIGDLQPRLDLICLDVGLDSLPVKLGAASW